MYILLKVENEMILKYSNIRLKNINAPQNNHLAKDKNLFCWFPKSYLVIFHFINPY